MKRIAISAAAFLLMLLMGMGLADPAFAEGMAPVAENLDLRTYRGVSVGGTLSAYDDGDVTILQNGKPHAFSKSSVAQVRLHVTF